MELLVNLIVISLKSIRKSKHIFNRLYAFSLEKTFTYAFLKYKGVDTQYGYVNLVGFPIIEKHPKSIIKIGKGVTLVSNSTGNIAGINHPVILSTLTENSFITIVGPFGASGSAIIAAKGITIKANSGLGVNSCIYDTDFHNVDPQERLKNWNNLEKSKEVCLGENVWVAANCIILKGVSIGNNSVIGAGSIVTKSVPENHLFAGNPAKKIKNLII